jgi:hypothetical protein
MQHDQVDNKKVFVVIFGALTHTSIYIDYWGTRVSTAASLWLVTTL